MSQPVKREGGVAGHYVEREDGRYEETIRYLEASGKAADRGEEEGGGGAERGERR